MIRSQKPILKCKCFKSFSKSQKDNWIRSVAKRESMNIHLIGRRG